jgi:hypothetical protein
VLPAGRLAGGREAPSASHWGLQVLFVGSAVGMTTKAALPGLLREAARHGLTIMGKGWGDEPEFAPYWKGVLRHVSEPEYAGRRGSR